MTLRLILIGFGNVGQGVAELLTEKATLLREDHGLDVRVVGIADLLLGSLHNPEGLDLVDALSRVRSGKKLGHGTDGFAGDALSLLDAADAEMMVEATYTDILTAEPATTHIRTALERGLHVTTTNKGPIALHLRELTQLARERGVQLLYEGTVMSGTPVLNLIRETLAGAEISSIQGILNGTTNYMLTRMEAGLDYETALAEAQQLGYAEAVPEADVLGWDALAKVTILATAVFGADCRPDDFPCRGIDRIDAESLAAAEARGQRIKLIGKVWREDGRVRAEVGPEAIDRNHPLAGVGGATNALTIATDTLGEITIVGPGAGRRETGYSVLVDIIRAGGDRP